VVRQDRVSCENNLDRYGRKNLPRDFDEIKKLLGKVNSETPVIVELGSGKGALKDIHPNYVGVDISLFALERYLINRRAVQADMQKLPFKENSADLIFSVAAIEHVPSPEKVFAEIDRMLKEGGLAYIFPAWFCRPWAAKGLLRRKFYEFSLTDKIIKFFIPFRNSIAWRSLFIISRRLFREFLYFFKPERLAFQYKRLTPNLKEYIDTDCDAFSSMDPHAVILYFHYRGYEILDGGNEIFRRILYRYKPVVVRKHPRN